MANRQKGAVSFEHEGETYTLRMATNEWCELEEEHGATTDELVKRFEKMAHEQRLDMRYLRSFFRAALAGERDGITLKEAGAIMTGLGLDVAAQKLGEAIQAGLPDEPESDGEARPPKAAAA